MLNFLIKVVLISSSGALAPGPLTASTMAIGVKHGWRGGLKVAFGHAIVEFPLVALIGFGLYSFLSSQTFVRFSSVLGGFFMLFFSYLTVKDALNTKGIETNSKDEYPILVGITLSALNPFFILWWISVGSALIIEALGYWGYLGIAPFYVAHVWLDFLWLILLAHITSLSGFSLKLYRSILIALGLVIAFFGLDFLYYGIVGVHVFNL